MVKLSDYIVKFLAGQGVRHVFTVSGAGNLHILDSLRRSTEIMYVCNHHEQACAMSMYSYARATESFGVALVTTGPGGTNAITGVCSAWVDSIPGLVLSGQVKIADTIGKTGVRQRGIQEINIIDLVRPITKYAVMITRPEDIRYHLEKACHLARTGRPGPVWLDVPLDLQTASINEDTLVGYDPATDADAGTVRTAALTLPTEAAARTVELLAEAKRPVLLAGHGIRLARAVPVFRTLLERLNIPVLVSWNALDLLENDHPLYVGRPGTYGQRGANFAIQNCDLLISLGARLSVPQTGYDYALFARAARKVYVDIDPTELGKYPVAPDLPVHADAGAFIKALLAALPGGIAGAAREAREAWQARCRDWKDRYPVCLPEYRQDDLPVNSFDFMDVLADELTEGDIVVPTASGSGFTSFHQAFRIKAGQRCFTSNGFAEMGFDLPGVIGACFGFDGRRIITMTGDGGVHMNIQELQTIVHHRLPVKIFVFCNQGYLTIRHTQTALFDGAFSGSDHETGVSLPDYVRLAEVYGLSALRIERRADLRDGIRKALATPGPVLCAVTMQPKQPLVPKTSFRLTETGTLVSPPLEDLFPFLPRDEFNANMLIPTVP